MTTIAGHLWQRATQASDAPAIVWQDAPISRGELRDRAAHLAGALAAHGVGQGSTVLVACRNRPEPVEILLACAGLGAAWAGVNPELGPDELAEVIEDADASVAFVDPALPPRITPNVLPAVVVELEDDRRGLHAFTLGSAPLRPRLDLDPKEVGALFYTSGSTGRPKGVELPAANLAGGVDDRQFGVEPGMVSLVYLPLFHFGGMMWMLSTLRQGGTAILLEGGRTDAILRTIERHRVTTAFFVPTTLAGLVTQAADGKHDLSSLKTVIYGAAPITPTLLRQVIDVIGCDLIQSYGITEAGGGLARLGPEDHTPESLHLGSVGTPLPGVELQVVDPSGAPLPCGEIGELWWRSPEPMRGYRNLPAMTADVLDADGWLRSGDAGWIDVDGYVYITGRVKEMIISGGENVFPGQVEAVLATHPGIRDVAVTGVPDADWGQVVKASIVRAVDADVDVAALAVWSRDRLAPHQRPRLIEFLSELPRNAVGKIDRRALIGDGA